MLHDAFLFEQAERFAERVALIVADRVAPSSSQVVAPASSGEKPADEARLREKQIEIAFQLALARKPTDNETAWCADLLSYQREVYLKVGQSAVAAAHHGLAQLCHRLFNTSEFLSVV